MLDNLTTRLGRIVKTLRGEARLTESNIQHALREVRVALLEADCAVPVVKDFIAAVREKALGQEVIGSLTPGQALVGVVHRELAHLMGDANVALDLAVQPPAVILMAGLQGSGKTTTTAKLARLLREQKKKVLVVSCDVYRPAAIDQLAAVAAQAQADFLPTSPDQAPADIARRALEHAKTHYHDVLIVDTAGRLAVDEAMMKEIAALHAILAPVETLFVVDAMQGQDAVNVAKAFNDALPLTGVILTKLDGDARGGAVRSPEDDRTVDLPARHVKGLRRGVHDLVDRLHREVEGHELDDRPQSHERGSDAQPREPHLGDRRVDDAPGAELVEQALAHLVGALVFGDLLAHQEHRRVAPHLLRHGVAQGLAHAQGPRLAPLGLRRRRHGRPRGCGGRRRGSRARCVRSPWRASWQASMS